MQASASSSIPSPAVLPAMALMETLTAAAILAGAALAFLAVLAQARADLAAARRIDEAAAIAAQALDDARADGLAGPFSGERDGYAWTLSCGTTPASPRLLLVACAARVERAGMAPVVLETAWTAPRQGFRP